jgi:hypothetical protein
MEWHDEPHPLHSYYYALAFWGASATNYTVPYKRPERQIPSPSLFPVPLWPNWRLWGLEKWTLNILSPYQRIHSLVCDNSWKPHVTPSPQVASPTIEIWTRIGGKFLRRRRLLDRASLTPGAKGFFFSWSGAHGIIRNITISCNILLWESLLHYDYLIYSRSDERVSISLVASAKAPGFKQDWSATAVSSLRLTKSRQWLCCWGCKTQKVRVCKAGGRDRERHIRDYGETWKTHTA